MLTDKCLYLHPPRLVLVLNTIFPSRQRSWKFVQLVQGSCGPKPAAQLEYHLTYAAHLFGLQTKKANHFSFFDKRKSSGKGNKAEPKENSALPGTQSPRRLKRSLGGETVSKSRLRNKVFKRKQIDGSRLKRLASCFLVVTMKSASKFPQWFFFCLVWFGELLNYWTTAAIFWK